MDETTCMVRTASWGRQKVAWRPEGKAGLPDSFNRPTWLGGQSSCRLLWRPMITTATATAATAAAWSIGAEGKCYGMAWKCSQPRGAVSLQ